VGGAKGLVDALVAAGLLVDDSEKHCAIEYRQDVVSKSPHRRVETCVTVSAVDAARAG
jgi:hypothetical protein